MTNEKQKKTTDDYRSNWDNIFKKDKEKTNQNEKESEPCKQKK